MPLLHLSFPEITPSSLVAHNIPPSLFIILLIAFSSLHLFMAPFCFSIFFFKWSFPSSLIPSIFLFLHGHLSCSSFLHHFYIPHLSFKPASHSSVFSLSIFPPTLSSLHHLSTNIIITFITLFSIFLLVIPPSSFETIFHHPFPLTLFTSFHPSSLLSLFSSFIHL